MQVVWKSYAKRNPELQLSNPWRESDRFKVKQSDRTAAWPLEVMIQVMKVATPELRAMLITLLQTSQRVGDVCGFTPDQYDKSAKILTFAQSKTDKPMVIHVPDFLATIFAEMEGRVSGRLLCTPRGVAWRPESVEDHVRRLRKQLRLPNTIVPHGLRATGPTQAAYQGASTRAIMAITGHDSEGEMERYLRGVIGFRLAKPEQEKLAEHYEPIVVEVQATGNQRRFTGVTGRAAAKARREGAGSGS
jgi:integrase